MHHASVNRAWLPAQDGDSRLWICQWLLWLSRSKSGTVSKQRDQHVRSDLVIWLELPLSQVEKKSSLRSHGPTRSVSLHRTILWHDCSAVCTDMRTMSILTWQKNARHTTRCIVYWIATRGMAIRVAFAQDKSNCKSTCNTKHHEQYLSLVTPREPRIVLELRKLGIKHAVKTQGLQQYYMAHTKIWFGRTTQSHA